MIVNAYENKVYFGVIETRHKEGRLMPLALVWENGIRYGIDKVLDVRQAASLKEGGAGMRYKIRVRDRETYLFLEENKSGAKWFMERKTS